MRCQVQPGCTESPGRPASAEVVLTGDRTALAVDPTRRRGGGALLGDRIRMNALG
jgi:putative protein kinase ArgK-like GTPase of G3E family